MQEKILKHKDLILPPNSKATYVKQTMKPAEGIVIERYSNGNIKTEVVYDDGYVVKVKKWYDCGQLEKNSEFKKDYTRHPLDAYGDSPIKILTYHRNGVLSYDGIDSWHQNGQIQREGSSLRVWHDNGKLEYDPKTGKHWHNNGQLAQIGNYVNELKKWDENGVLREEILIVREINEFNRIKKKLDEFREEHWDIPFNGGFKKIITYHENGKVYKEHLRTASDYYYQSFYITTYNKNGTIINEGFFGEGVESNDTFC